MYSKRYPTERAMEDPRTCLACKTWHGKIHHKDEWIFPQPPLRLSCRCVIERFSALFAGAAANGGERGADWRLKRYGGLPGFSS